MAYATARAIAVDDIPVVDIAPLVARDQAGSATAGAAMREASERIGFFYIAGHGVPEAMTANLFAAAARFFALPAAAKAEVAVNRRHRGWIGTGGAKMYGTAKADLKESFVWGLELPETDAEVAAGTPLMGPNQWPAALPELRAALYPWYEAVMAAGHAVLRGLALSLGRDMDFFVASYRRPLARGSAIWYPPQPPELGREQFGVAPHTDYGGLTLLAQDMTGGLQVKGTDREWVMAHPIPGTFVVNIGDLMHRWTNGRFRSNPHRVVNTSGRTRQSAAVFFDPGFHAVVDPRDLLDDPAEAKYPPIACGEWVVGRFDKAFKYRAPGA
ncbi:isopenicillin N synthase family dioxygenase [Falsiroseomonas oryzae]|uniref:isopenicillin N synthase family dioxygenase n=1 Tax=Falsiroseomonas oryzae TaxID=2766473 RepID=UPI0022EA4FB0|nr:2-oxoglutarate and iron-dependent oxygenase domain-containing protein [Roseomonas sp. MO-31]